MAIRIGSGRWISRDDCSAGLAGGGATDLLESRPERMPGPGRGRAPVVLLRIGDLDAVGKRCRHGGLLAPILGGLFLGGGRAVRPLEAAVRLRAAGVRTPAVLAAGWRRVVGPLCAHALVTEAIPAATNLHAALAVRPGPARRRALLDAAGLTVAAMHDAGFLHADLNLANLVLEETRGRPLAHIVDLDRGRFVARLTEAERLSNLRRILRSWEKWLGDSAPPGARDGVAFLRPYCRGDRAEMRRLLGDLASYRGRLGPRRWVWRRLRGSASGPAATPGAEQR